MHSQATLSTRPPGCPRDPHPLTSRPQPPLPQAQPPGALGCGRLCLLCVSGLGTARASVTAISGHLDLPLIPASHPTRMKLLFKANSFGSLNFYCF